MGDGDWRVLKWYQAKCVGAGKELNLVPMFFERLGLEGAQEDLFLMKLDEVMGLARRMEIAEMEKHRSK
jgi:hypothetical protein